MATDVDYELSGVANGSPILLTGKGAVDPAQGVYELTIKLDYFPMGWDPAMVILICCERMLGFASTETAGAKNLWKRCGDDYTILDRSGEGRFSDGRQLFSARATSMGRMVDGRLKHRSQIHQFHSNMLPDEQIASITTPYSAIARPLGGAGLLMTSTFLFDTNHEKGCFGFTNYPIIGPSVSLLEADKVALVSVSNVDFKTTRNADGNGTFNFRVQSKIKEVSI